MKVLKRKKRYVRKKRIVRAHSQHYHINPMRPRDTNKIPTGKEWVHQPKYDGSRSYLITTPRNTLLVNRRQVEKSRLYPELNQLHKNLGPGHIIDGEVVQITKEEPYGSFLGLSHRDRLKKAEPSIVKKYPLTFIAFDTIKANGKDITKYPLRYRDKVMRRIIPQHNKIKEIKNYQKPPTQQMRRAKAEGIISKKLSSSYQEGKTSSDWLKKKFTKEADLKVLGLTEGTGRRKKFFGAIRVGVYKNGRIREVAKVGSGFSDEQLRQYKKNLPPYLRVKYRKIGSDGRLMETRSLGPRYDITDKDTHL